jgi:hypothetical protein
MKIYVEYKQWFMTSPTNIQNTVWLESTNDYRNKENLSTKISQSVIKNSFLSFNEEICEKFLKDHVCASIWGSIIDIKNIDDVKQVLTEIVGYNEIEGMCEVTPVNEMMIYNIIKNAG